VRRLPMRGTWWKMTFCHCSPDVLSLSWVNEHDEIFHMFLDRLLRGNTYRWYLEVACSCQPRLFHTPQVGPRPRFLSFCGLSFVLRRCPLSPAGFQAASHEVQNLRFCCGISHANTEIWLARAGFPPCTSLVWQSKGLRRGRGKQGVH
jgi:hypothetical protein